MVALQWDLTGQRLFETGVDHGVLYSPNAQGVYDSGVSWNGLTTVTESPSGAESNPQYADNIKYLNLLSAEEFGATIEAFTFPSEFLKFDGGAIINQGIVIGQQNRTPFGLSYRTLIGNDLAGRDYGYKIHLIYGAQAAPSEKAYATVNDSPEAITFSWELTTSAVAVGTINGVTYKPTASLTVDSTKVSAANLKTLEDILYGTAGTNPRLPLPAEVIAIFAGTITPVGPTLTPIPTAVAGGTISVPATTGVDWVVDGVVYSTATTGIPFAGTAGTARKVVTAQTKPGFAFAEGTLTAYQLTKVA